MWGYDYGIGKQIKLHGVMPYLSVTVDGREGVAASAIITRDDGATDFGYLATVQGDPNAPVDTPDLLLLVERTAANSKGRSPVSAEDIDEIGKAISASIKLRPSSPWTMRRSSPTMSYSVFPHQRGESRAQRACRAM